VAGIWKILGTSVHAERVLGFAIHAALAIASGLLAGKMSGHWFSFLFAGLASLWLSFLTLVPYAWLASLFAAFAATLLLARALNSDSSRGWAAAAGVALGLVSYFRHDLFVYLAVSLTGVLVLVAITSIEIRSNRKLWSRIWCVALVAALTVAVFWIPVFIIAGPERVADDLYFDQVRYVWAARLMPLPSLAVLRGTFPAKLPVFLVRLFEGSVALTFAGPLLAILVATVVGSSRPIRQR
jgi:hypothetical protein